MSNHYVQKRKGSKGVKLMLKTILVNNFQPEDLKNQIGVMKDMDITLIFNVRSLEGLIRELREYCDCMDKVLQEHLDAERPNSYFIPGGIKEWDENQYRMKRGDPPDWATNPNLKHIKEI